ncbi:MAG: hypothetical protein HOW73_13110 [Polyangiaceae bacterium]|nr:hypothetical protein [Polyangiaceae bacterium]
MRKLPAGDPGEQTQYSQPAQKTIPQEPLELTDPVDPTPRPTLVDGRPWLTRPVKIGLGVVGGILAIIGALLLYVTLRFDAVLRGAIEAEAKERGMKIEFDEVESTGILPWHAGKPKVVLKGVKLTSDEAPDVEIEVDRIDVPLKGTFPAYEPGVVEVAGAEIESPDFPSIIALEKAAKTGKASKTTANISDAKIRVARLSQQMPLTVVGKAKRIDVAEGNVDLDGVTLELPVPFVDVKLGPVDAQIQRQDDMTWARLDDYQFARFGMRDDAVLAKLQADPVDSQSVGKDLGLDLPPMKISGEVEATLKGEEAMSGTFSILLDGYVPPHPKELDGILHEKKTKLTGKLRYGDNLIHFDDLVVESGGLKMKGNGKLDWANGGTLVLNLNGSVGCAQLATSAIGSRLGPLAGSLTGSLAGGRLTGTVGVTVGISTKLSEIKNLTVTPRVSIACSIGL